MSDRLTTKTVSWLLAIGLTITALLLWERLAEAHDEAPVIRAKAGERLKLEDWAHAAERTVELPTHRVKLTVGDPISRIGSEAIGSSDDPRFDSSTYSDFEVPSSLQAPEGGTLIPITWTIRWTRQQPAADPPPVQIDLRLVAGDQERRLVSEKVSLTSPRSGLYETKSYLFAFKEEVGADQVSVEVGYDGETQVLNVGSGKIDPGRAAPLYEADRHYRTGCEAQKCDLHSKVDDLRPDTDQWSSSSLIYAPYYPGLGWAEDGKQWAWLRVNYYGAFNVKSREGKGWSLDSNLGPKLTLDGQRPRKTEDLTADPYASGTAIWEVDRDRQPGQVTIKQTYDFVSPAAPYERWKSRDRARLTLVD